MKLSDYSRMESPLSLKTWLILVGMLPHMAVGTSVAGDTPMTVWFDKPGG